MATSRITATNENVSTYDSGGGKDYSDMGTWEAATDIDLVSASQSEVLECYVGNHSDACNMGGATCDSSYFRIVRPASGNMHDGIPKNDGTIVSFAPDIASGTAFDITETYSCYQDLCVIWAANSGSACYCFGADAANSRLIGCMAKGTNIGGEDGRSFDADGASILINCLGYESSEDNYKLGSGTLVYNCTAIDAGDDNFDDGNNSCTFKNCLADNAGNLDYETPGSMTTCGSSDATGSVGFQGQSYTFVDAVNDDYHLVQGSDGIGDGTDVSGDGYGDDDIDLDGRGTTWDIGFDEFTFGYINIGGDWKTINSVQINIGDAWKDVSGMQINIGDAWKTIF